MDDSLIPGLVCLTAHFNGFGPNEVGLAVLKFSRAVNSGSSIQASIAP